MPAEKLLFIDTNIWLDFYRGRGADLSLKLLENVKTLADRLIVTYQIEMEFKKNRQSAILEGISDLKTVVMPPRLGIFSDDDATQGIAKCAEDAKKHIGTLRGNLARALREPEKFDPVYAACEKLFAKTDSLSLLRSDEIRREIREKAETRYAQGYPPRKTGDTSFGDAINWEWIVKCAELQHADVVIVSRDSDYGAIIKTDSYINDHLRQEFGERVGEGKKIQLYSYLTNALKQFKIPVTKQDVAAERAIVEESESTSIGELMTAPTFEHFMSVFKRIPREKRSRLIESLAAHRRVSGELDDSG